MGSFVVVDHSSKRCNIIQQQCFFLCLCHEEGGLMEEDAMDRWLLRRVYRVDYEFPLEVSCRLVDGSCASQRRG